MEQKIYSIEMGAAKCAVDLGDGSERGEYVDQDYILHKMGRPHRAISLMYCYYPLDKTWPVRARDAFADQEVSFQWDYPYDDYFTYKGGIGGTTDGELHEGRPPPRSGRYPHHDYRPQPHRRLPY